MSGEWREVSLQEVTQLIARGLTPAYSDASGIPVLNQKCIRDYRVEYQLARITDPTSRKIPSDKILRDGDLLINSTGQGTLGRVAQVFGLATQCTADSHVTIVRPIESAVDIGFLGWHLKGRQSEIESLAEGSTGQTELSRYKLADLIIPLPPLPEQRRIAKILGDLDDKIELNRKMNETLEQMARALFKSWFIDFDPVHRNAAVRLDKPVNSYSITIFDHIFSDSFKESDIGIIPEKSEVCSLYDTAEYINGAAFSSSDFCESAVGLPVIKIAELKYGLSQQTKYSTRQLPENQMVRHGDLLYSWSGSPDTSLDVFIWTLGDGLLNQHIFKVVCNSEPQKHFVYYLLRHLRSVLVEIARNKQTTGLGHVTVADMRRLMLCTPSPKLLQSCDEVFSKLFKQCLNLQVETEKLIDLRLGLVSRLLSKYGSIIKS
jgi:type I restriction enzyme S subunit